VTGDAATDAAAYLGGDRQSLFDAYVAAITNVELVSTDGLALLGTTWDRELARTRARFLSAATAEDVYYALLSLKNSYHDAHSTFFPSASWNLKSLPSQLLPGGARVHVQANVRVEYENGAAFYRAEGAGIDAGSTIVSVNGVSIGQVEDQLREWYPLHSPEGLREFVAGSLVSRSPSTMPSPNPGDIEQLALTDSSGKPYQVNLTWTVAPSSSTSSGCARYGTSEAASDYSARTSLATGMNYCVYDGGASDLRVVRYYSFQYDTPADMLADEAALVSYLHQNGVERVLFDVRENGGGGVDPTFFGNFTSTTYAFVSNRLYYADAFKGDPGLISSVLFLDQSVVPTLESALASDPAATFSPELPMICKTAGCPLTDVNYPPAASAVEAIVLTGPGCVSACDNFVSVMKDNNIAKLAGMPSAAADSPHRYWAELSLADGEAFDLVLTVAVSDRPGTNGVVLEGHPPAIDFPVSPTPSNRGGYLNAVLGTIVWPQ
jgi:hypothetical protein